MAFYICLKSRIIPLANCYQLLKSAEPVITSMKSGNCAMKLQEGIYKKSRHW